MDGCHALMEQESYVQTDIKCKETPADNNVAAFQELLANMVVVVVQEDMEFKFLTPFPIFYSNFI